MWTQNNRCEDVEHGAGWERLASTKSAACWGWWGKKTQKKINSNQTNDLNVTGELLEENIDNLR